MVDGKMVDGKMIDGKFRRSLYSRQTPLIQHASRRSSSKRRSYLRVALCCLGFPPQRLDTSSTGPLSVRDRSIARDSDARVPVRTRAPRRSTRAARARRRERRPRRPNLEWTSRNPRRHRSRSCKDRPFRNRKPPNDPSTWKLPAFDGK